MMSQKNAVRVYGRQAEEAGWKLCELYCLVDWQTAGCIGANCGVLFSEGKSVKKNDRNSTATRMQEFWRLS